MALRTIFAPTASAGSSIVEPTRRPGMARWAEHLHRAADNTLRCPACGGSYFRTGAQCPWCETPRPAFVVLGCELWDPDRVIPSNDSGHWVERAGSVTKPGQGGGGKARPIDSASIGVGDALELTDRFTAGESAGKPQLRVRHEGSTLRIEALVPGPWRLTSLDGRGDRRLEHGPCRDSSWAGPDSVVPAHRRKQPPASHHPVSRSEGGLSHEGCRSDLRPHRHP